MATLTAFSSTDMTASTFVEDAGMRVVDSIHMNFFENAGEREWDFGCNGNLPADNSRPVSGFVNTSDYFDGGAHVFAITGLVTDNQGAPTVFDFFEAGDDLGLFAYLFSANDKFTGSTQNDVLNGWGGNDTMSGGAGLDRLNGATGDDVLRGVLGDDKLNGGAGADRLEGGLGLDQLTGGAGADKFVFNTAPSNSSADTVVDFRHGVDKLLLDNDALTALGAPGALPAAQFVSATNISATSTTGLTPDDRILYDKDSGHLYYDANGSDAGERVLLATVLDGAGHAVFNLGLADFRVI